MNGTAHILRLLKAEARQFWWLSPAVLVAGLGVWALLVAVTARVPTEARPTGIIFNHVGSLALSVFPLLLAAPAIAGLGVGSRLGLWLGLPVPRRTVNLVRLLGGTLHVWPALLTWPLIISLLARVYGPVPPWVVADAALLVGIGLMLSTRTALAPFLVFALLPVQVILSHFIPGGRPLGDSLAFGLASPWTTAVLLLLAAGLLAWTLQAPPPRRGAKR